MLKNKVEPIHEIDRVYLEYLDADIIKLNDYIDFFGHKYLYEAIPRNQDSPIAKLYIDPNHYYYEVDGKMECMATVLNRIKNGFVID